MSDRPPARLLIVEDDRSLAFLLKKLLEKEGYTVLAASDGAEALDLLAEHGPPDLIVSDILMPNVDGFELLRRVRAVDEWLDIPFLFLSAMGETEDKIQGRALGVDDYITKPFDFREFVAVVTSKVERARAVARRQTSQIAELKRQILMLLNHEFRTPLTLIVAYTNMLDDFGERDMTREELIDFMQNITSGAQRLRRLIENFILLVELSYPADGEPAHRLRRIDDVRQLLRESLDSVSRRIDSHHFEFVVNPALPPFDGDRETLIIALRELIDNAIKASPAGTVIEIGAHEVNGEVVLQVEDHGRGIPEVELNKLGAAFYQIERGRLDGQGAGTGLAIVGAIARLHGGRVTVESRPGERTVFALVLPAAAPR